MTKIEPATGWIRIFEIPTFNLDEVTAGNDEYIDKSYARVRQSFNNTWICRYPRPCKVLFDNGSEFKWYFTPLLKYFDIKPVLTTIKNPQANAPVERVHQVILNMLVIKYIDKKVFDHIESWGETLSSIAWSIRSSLSPYYNSHTRPRCLWQRHDIQPCVSRRLASCNQSEAATIGNWSCPRNDRRLMHDYAIGDQVYV